MKPAIFLDRDGVVIENRSAYVRRWEDVEIFPAAIEILSSLASSPYQIIFVTNQSAIGRGIISLETAQKINQRLISVLTGAGCRVDGVFMCPHAPEDKCSCRKPLPGLFFQASQKHHIDLTNSIMIGDAWTDMQAGIAAGIPVNGLVLTGRGREQQLLQRPPEARGVSVFADLTAAIESLIPAV